MNIRKAPFTRNLPSKNKKKWLSYKWLFRTGMIVVCSIAIMELCVIINHDATSSIHESRGHSSSQRVHDHSQREPRWKTVTTSNTNTAAASKSKYIRREVVTATAPSNHEDKEQQKTVEDEEEVDMDEVKEKELAQQEEDAIDDKDLEEIVEKDAAEENDESLLLKDLIEKDDQELDDEEEEDNDKDNTKSGSHPNFDATQYPHTASLPQWIQTYIAWHKEMRTKFPGKELFTNPKAPKILIRTCLGLCGGLHDRLGQLPWDVYLANQTQRILLMQWERPQPLQDFLVPSEVLDWTVPAGIYQPSKPGKVSPEVRAIPQLFHKNCTQELYETNPEPEFWSHDLEVCLTQAQEPTAPRVLRHRLLGHLDEDKLESRLMAVGETDMMHWKPSFGHLFLSFFTPSAPVQTEIEEIHNSLGIAENSYSAVHCRVRHPKATPKKIFVKGMNANYPADKTGLPWEGITRDFAIATASKALQCAKRNMLDDANNRKEPIYFFSDSNDLVRFISHELTSPSFLHANSTLLNKGSYDQDALQQVQSVSGGVISRSSEVENAHIDRQKGRPAEAYYGTFVDLWIALQARCVTYGIGYFALFATKIVVGDPNKCTDPLVYQEEAWGGRAGTKKGGTSCPIHDSKYDELWK